MHESSCHLLARHSTQASPPIAVVGRTAHCVSRRQLRQCALASLQSVAVLFWTVQDSLHAHASTPHAAYRCYCCFVPQVDAIVYLVDAADRERFPESQRELAGLLSDDGLSGVPFLVLGNKIDLPYAGACCA